MTESPNRIKVIASTTQEITEVFEDPQAPLEIRKFSIDSDQNLKELIITLKDTIRSIKNLANELRSY
jgi:hypothetical protein